MSILDRLVFLVVDGEIIRTSIREAPIDYIDETRTAQGMQPVLFVKGNEIHGRGTDFVDAHGNANFYTELVSDYESQEKAVQALEAIQYRDFWDCAHGEAFKTYEEAERYLETRKGT